MTRTVETCSLIKKNVSAGRGKPTIKGEDCEGYIRRGKIHQICKDCDLCLSNYRHQKRGK